METREMPKDFTPSRTIPSQQYRYIEAMLYQYKDSVDAIRQYRETCIYGSPSKMPSVSQGHAFVSDPTAKAAERLVDVPESIANAERWVSIVEYTMNALRQMDQQTGGCLLPVCQGFYINRCDRTGHTRANKTYTIRELMESLHLEERTLYSLRQQIVTLVWGIALSRGVLTI